MNGIKVGLKEDLKQLATENVTAATVMSAKEKEKAERMQKKLNDTLE